jgi:serine kinase of HPr protein (carbohydrate metabolism regulator)
MSETVHGTAVLVGAMGVLIRGASGSGKSALALELIRRGARLIADDRMTLTSVGGRAIATVQNVTAGLIELRGRGVVRVPHERSAVIRLVADIVAAEGLERMPEPSQLTVEILGIALPRQPVPGVPEQAAALVDAALAALSSQPDNGLAQRDTFGKMTGLPTPTASA